MSQAQALLRSRAEDVTARLTTGLQTGTTTAVKQVYTFATALMILSFLAALLLPDLELGGTAHARRTAAQ